MIAVFIATSLDGYITDSQGKIDFLSYENPSSDCGFKDFISRMDVLVMGKNTYNTVLSFGFWPYEIPVVVLTHQTITIPAEYHDKIIVMQGDPHVIVSELSTQGFQNIYLDGGVVIQQFLAADLVDEMTLSRLPVLLGGGTPLFGSLSQAQSWKMIETKVFDEVLVQSRYQRVRI